MYDLSGTPSNIASRPSDVPDILDGRGMRSLIDMYLPGRTALDARDPACSPLYADLTGLPAALFTVGHADHLLDDTLFMAARWQAFGNETALAVYPDCASPTSSATRSRGPRSTTGDQPRREASRLRCNPAAVRASGRPATDSNPKEVTMATTTLDAARSLAGKLTAFASDLPADELAVLQGIVRSVEIDPHADVEGFATVPGLVTLEFAEF